MTDRVSAGQGDLKGRASGTTVWKTVGPYTLPCLGEDLRAPKALRSLRSHPPEHFRSRAADSSRHHSDDNSADPARSRLVRGCAPVRHADAAFRCTLPRLRFDELTKAARKAKCEDQVRAAALHFLETGEPPYRQVTARRGESRIENREGEWQQLLAEIRLQYGNRPRFMEILQRLDGGSIVQGEKARRKP